MIYLQLFQQYNIEQKQRIQNNPDELKIDDIFKDK